MTTVLGNFSQLPMNIAHSAGPDTTNNHFPAGPSTAPQLTFPQNLLPQDTMPSIPSVPTQPQYVTDFTCMFNVLADNQIAFQ